MSQRRIIVQRRLIIHLQRKNANKCLIKLSTAILLFKKPAENWRDVGLSGMPKLVDGEPIRRRGHDLHSLHRAHQR